MLHATIYVDQIMTAFQVRAVITEFAPGTDPVVWSSGVLTLDLDDDQVQEDALSITLECLALWSEMTRRP